MRHTCSALPVELWNRFLVQRAADVGDQPPPPPPPPRWLQPAPPPRRCSSSPTVLRRLPVRRFPGRAGPRGIMCLCWAADLRLLRGSPSNTRLHAQLQAAATSSFRIRNCVLLLNALPFPLISLGLSPQPHCSDSLLLHPALSRLAFSPFFLLCFLAPPRRRLARIFPVPLLHSRSSGAHRQIGAASAHLRVHAAGIQAGG